jgi:hypothetical protein
MVLKLNGKDERLKRADLFAVAAVAGLERRIPPSMTCSNECGLQWGS